MEPLQFAYWLQGFSELNAAPPSVEQWQAIRDHLATVFVKVTPPVQVPGGLDLRDLTPGRVGWPVPGGAGDTAVGGVRRLC